VGFRRQVFALVACSSVAACALIACQAFSSNANDVDSGVGSSEAGPGNGSDGGPAGDGSASVSEGGDAGAGDGSTALAFMPFGTISAGDVGSCLVRKGSVYCWGSDQYGEIGNGTTGQPQPPLTAANIPGAKYASIVSVGFGFVCAVAGGAVHCWGADNAVQVGNGSSMANVTTPYAVPSPVKDGGWPDAGAITTGQTFACALSADGRVFCWGDNTTSICADNSGGGMPNCYSPTQQDQLTAPARGIAAGDSFVCALVADAGPECWGSDDKGQLGSKAQFVSQGTFTPYEVPELAPSNVGPLLAITASDQHACVIVASSATATSGGVQCWGSNATQQLGAGFLGSYSTKPVLITGLQSGVVQIAAGGRGVSTGHTCALREDGSVGCWGAASYGELGVPAGATSATVQNVPLPGRAVTIAAGPTDSCALLESGDAYCWGADNDKQLGDTMPGDAGPVRVALP
jgi:hypothetical protein